MQNDVIDKLACLLKEARKNADMKFVVDYDDVMLDMAEYLIANGVILPPCNVGDKVYYIDGKTIVPSVVHCISFGGRHGVNPKGQIHIQDSDKDTITVNFDQFGKKVFKTYEEAEQKLEGGE